MAKLKIKQLSIKERMKLLDEVIDLYTRIGKEREDMDYMLFKVAAMIGTKEAFEYISKEVLDKELETEDDIKQATFVLLQTMDFAELMEEKWISSSDSFRFYWGIGLAIWILRWEQKLIKDYEEVRKAREDNDKLCIKVNLIQKHI